MKNMDQKLLKTQLLSDLQEKGCADSMAIADCISQTLAASDMLATYSELLCYALSLYDARMWGRKKNNDMVQQERQRREKLFSQPVSCLASSRKEPKASEIRIGKLILKKKR